MLENQIKVLLTVAIIGATFMSCGKTELYPEQYVKWVVDFNNGLNISKKIDKFQFDILYKPADYIVLQELTPEAISPAEFKRRKSELEGMDYFTFRISSLDNTEVLNTAIADWQDYFSRLQYFTTVASRDFKVVEGTDTLNCLLYHFERNYGVAPYNNIVLGFEKKPDSSEKSVNDKIFLFHDRVLGTGLQVFTIRKEDINRIPHLKL